MEIGNMEIDNFDKLRNIVTFKEGYFHLLYIIQRDKDHIHDGLYIDYNTYGSHGIKYWYITSMEDLNKVEPLVKLICKDTKSRAYFILNLINILDFNKELNNHIKNLYEIRHVNKCDINDIIHHTYSRGKEKNKLDIVNYCHLDLDGDLSSEENTNLYIDILREMKPDIKIINIFPTKTGSHLITTAFDLQEYYKYLYDRINRFPRAFIYVGVMIYLNLNDCD